MCLLCEKYYEDRHKAKHLQHRHAQEIKALTDYVAQFNKADEDDNMHKEKVLSFLSWMQSAPQASTSSKEKKATTSSATTSTFALKLKKKETPIIISDDDDDDITVTEARKRQKTMDSSSDEEMKNEKKEAAKTRPTPLFSFFALKKKLPVSEIQQRPTLKSRDFNV